MSDRGNEFRRLDPGVVALLELYWAQVGDVHRYLLRLTGGDVARTEDLVQEVFMVLAQALADGRPPDQPVAWLISRARWVFLHDDRRERRADRRAVRVGTRRQPESIDPADTVHAVALRAAVGRLSDIERAALVFRYIDDLAVIEVAALVGRSVEATESLLVRARHRLRSRLAYEEHDDGR